MNPLGRNSASVRPAVRLAMLAVPLLSLGLGCTEVAPTAPTFALVITTAALPSGIENVPYQSQQLGASGGEGQIEWTLASGSLPSGITLSPSGELTGTPDQAGTSSFVVRVTSREYQSAQRTLTISVFPPLEVTTASLPSAMEAVPYGPLSLQATGGDAAYTWQVVTGSLPSGLVLSSQGVITGTPAELGVANFTVQVTGGDGQTAQHALAINVRAFLGIATMSLPFGVEGMPYGPQTLGAIGGGTGEVWTLTGGALPSGLTLSVDGGISGTPQAPGTAAFVAQVAATDGRTAQRALSIDVHESLVVTTLSLPDAVANVSYGPQLLAARGGVGPNSWTVVSGLPNGLTLGSNGALAGTADAVGTYELSVQVSSGDGQVAQGIIALTVTPQPVLLPSANCADHPPYAIATFEDPSLEAGVRAALRLGAGEQLTCAIAAGLTVLDQVHGNERGITSLVGMQNLVGLQTLWLASNLITDIGPLSALTALSEIHLQHNSIVDVSPVAGLTALRILSFWDNEIVDVSPLAGLTQLTFLQLSDNQITDVSALAGLVNIVFLRLYQNYNLVDITALLNNPGLGAGDELRVLWTQIGCSDLAVLIQRGVTVYSEYDPTGLVPWNELCP
jgi:hypothetical protein